MLRLLPVPLVLLAITALAYSGLLPEAVFRLGKGLRIAPDYVESPSTPLYDGFSSTASTVLLGEETASQYAVLIDLEEGTILAAKDPRTSVSPASMTKVLTLLVAVERIDDLDAAVTITGDILAHCRENDCSTAGFAEGEAVTLRDLLYGAILPSGADASLALAEYVAGSEAAFAALMNEKAVQLGLSDGANFVNCVGLYHPEHLCSVYDMALILRAALEDELCREVLSRAAYRTAPTPQHPEGIQLTNRFLQRIGEQDCGQVVVTGAKTGYVDESGNCAASFALDGSGRMYLCVTAKAQGSWACTADHAALYALYAGGESAAPGGIHPVRREPAVA